MRKTAGASRPTSAVFVPRKPRPPRLASPAKPCGCSKAGR